MLHLSFEGIVHRDLAARNILLSSALDSKISDFGMSRKLDHIGDANKTQQEVGPIKWMVKINLLLFELESKLENFNQKFLINQQKTIYLYKNIKSFLQSATNNYQLNGMKKNGQQTKK